MDEVKAAFDAGASEYDTHRKWIIPEFETFYGAAVWAAAWQGEAPSILDVGAGTGLLSALLLQRYPAASVTLIDNSERMLEVARQRFAGREGVHYLVGDYRQERLSHRYDLIASALSIHHLKREEKYALYQRIFEALKPGGVFVNAEQVKGESAWQQERNFAYWDAFVNEGPLPPETKVEILERRDRLDKMEKLSVQMQWLTEIGFVDVDVVYKNRPFAVFSGRRA
ncbi:class I SAM-dependent methyltransferase [Methanofollis aquaemaris]|uniref:Class I SAM-dependent methyltransferase n=1 Tax=Methanofollis aquaemaris TaxID=126734 RepID=A0A8A3S318_9EURY|nr:class I SAM-dependent methyltransferase [Methanofollis aquaemaris]QSZ66141.1 class I SAM-dependent methyltransferase [Methanofollis aquaemaris]